MRDLVPITEHNGQKAVSARELYDYLEVKERFSDWTARMFSYGFLEKTDYTPQVFLHPQNKQHLLDYALTIRCAKEISMLQRTDKGKAARAYFMECERLLSEIVAPGMPAIPQTLREALLLAADLEAERERLAAEVSVLAPKAAYTDTVLSSVSEWTTTTIAKELGMSAVRLNAELYRLGIQYQNSDGAWVLYAKHQANGYTKTRTHAHADSGGKVHTKIYTVWTEKGRKFIHDLLSVPA